ncbi:MAG: recombinase [Thiotrichales bacterium]|nr:MAG: recombinase [Thiotrichales bacterium]
MKALINKQLIAKLQSKDKQFEIWDTNLTGLVLRVNPSGKMNYVCQYKKNRRITIGSVNVLSPMQARDRVKEILGNATKGIYPEEKKDKSKNTTFQTFIEKEYAPWFIAQKKSGEAEINKIRRNFYKLFDGKLLADINLATIEKWRTKRLQNGISPSTINRDITALKAALNRAVQWGLLSEYPFRNLKQFKDESERVRYLSKDEEYKLRNAFDNREERFRQERCNANKWRASRGYDLMPTFSKTIFVDHMKPMFLLTLNTGLRRSELFHLTWIDINLELKLLTLPKTKAYKKRHIPLNKEAHMTLKTWHKQSLNKINNLVFPSENSKPFDNIYTAWGNIMKNAQIEDFRFHDLRHDFASKLVMAGVDLNTVRELLGHSDIKMTLRYAHLAPEHKANAVAKLDKLI